MLCGVRYGPLPRWIAFPALAEQPETLAVTLRRSFNEVHPFARDPIKMTQRITGPDPATHKCQIELRRGQDTRPPRRESHLAAAIWHEHKVLAARRDQLAPHVSDTGKKANVR